jgi:hypothetical protein
MGRGLETTEHSSLTIANIESSFHEQGLTIPPAQQVAFETTNSILIDLSDSFQYKFSRLSHFSPINRFLSRGGIGWRNLSKCAYETVERPPSEKLMENVHMQGFRNPEE